MQKPHPPILMGGDGPTTFDRIAEFGDGWMPIGRPGHNPALHTGGERLRVLLERLGFVIASPSGEPARSPPRRGA